jgi:hypothetical protein
MTTPNAALADEQRAREILAAAWGDHPQWADVRARILDGSCSIHSDTLSLSCSIAVTAILTALRQPSSVSRVREALEAALCAPSWSDSLGHVHESLAALPLDEVSDESRS